MANDSLRTKLNPCHSKNLIFKGSRKSDARRSRNRSGPSARKS